VEKKGKWCEGKDFSQQGDLTKTRAYVATTIFTPTKELCVAALPSEVELISAQERKKRCVQDEFSVPPLFPNSCEELTYARREFLFVKKKSAVNFVTPGRTF
jgi:hypothetical protein